MKGRSATRWIAFGILIVIDLGCGKGGGGGGGALGSAPELGGRTLTVVGSSRDGLSAPRDLKFNPAHPEQLWVVNQGSNGVVLYTDAGKDSQKAVQLLDYYRDHFMAQPSALSFADSGLFATCQESRNDSGMGGGEGLIKDFMGPTLWTSDLNIFAKVHQGDDNLNGSHIDMLHESPLCMGVVWDSANVYWAFDGLAGNLVRYDFQKDHGPGGDDHSDGIVRRFVGATVTRVENVPGHLALDHGTGRLYVADTGTGRIMRLDTKSGKATGMLPQLEADPLVEYSKMEGASYSEFVTGLVQPSGLYFDQGRLFVSEHGSGTVKAYSVAGGLLGTLETGAKGLMGLTIGPDHKLWYVDRDAQTVVRVDP